MWRCRHACAAAGAATAELRVSGQGTRLQFPRAVVAMRGMHVVNALTLSTRVLRHPWSQYCCHAGALRPCHTKAYLSHVYWASMSLHIFCYSTLHRSWHATHPTPPLVHEEGASQASTSKLTRQCDHTWARRISISGHRHCRLCVIGALAKSGFAGKDTSTCSRALGGTQAG